MQVIFNLFGKIKQALSTEWGWFIGIMTSAFVSTQDVKLGIYVVLGAVLSDLFWGVWAAIILKKFLLSVFWRETLKKFAIYFFALTAAFVLETFASTSYIAFKTFVILITVCEIWSMSASMLIVKPNTPFLKIMRVQLKGEIQSKVGKHVDIDNMLKDDTTDNTSTTKADSDIRQGK